MARFKIGDYIECNMTAGKYCNVKGIIIGLAQMQYCVPGQLYDTPSWKIKTNDGQIVSLSEVYLNSAKE